MVATGWWTQNGGHKMVKTKWWIQNGEHKMVDARWWTQDGGHKMVDPRWWTQHGGHVPGKLDRVALSVTDPPHIDSTLDMGVF